MNEKRTTLAVMASALICGAALAARAQPNAAPSSNSVAADINKTSTFSAIDALLSQLATATSDLQKFVSTGKAAAGSADKDCVDNFSPKALTMAVLPNAMAADVIAYHQCRALVEKSQQPCNALDLYKFAAPRSELTSDCRGLSVKLAAARSIIAQAPDAIERCSEWAAKTGMSSRYPAESVNKVCALIVSPADAHTVGAQVAVLLKFAPDEGAEVVRKIGDLKGEEKEACSKLANETEQSDKPNNCSAFSAYRRAFAAKNSSLCGDSWVCRLMMNKSGNCDAYENKLAVAYCRSSAQEKFKSHSSDQEQQEVLFAQKKPSVDSLLAQSAQFIEGFSPKNTRGYRSRKEHYIALRDEALKAIHDYHPVNTKRAAKAKKTDDQ